jgi:2-polyprenyl-6-methoxyphenol hydroxylase-like FAD-dependent oxidoreductase
MRTIDVAILGGGLAGSTAAAMLGRAGVSAALVDPHEVYPADFRCEKLNASQIDILRKTGLEPAVSAASKIDEEILIMRFGREQERLPSRQYGILYDTLVNTMRGQIRPPVDVLHAKAIGIITGGDRQIVTLSTGEELNARLVVFSNGLNVGPLHQLGITRNVISECHSISIGFDVASVDAGGFKFRALTCHPRRAHDRMAYCTFFPTAKGMRMNLFVYREMNDPWLRLMRRSPAQTLITAMPELAGALSNFEVKGDVRIRPVDLYETGGHQQPGVVLVGDAFATSCPAAGTGTNKVFTDVERLCNTYIPQWLASEGMGADKIGQFYDDPVKTACDAASLRYAFRLRSLSVDNGLFWKAQRWARFLMRLGAGTWRKLLSPAASDRRLPVSGAD